MKYTHEEIEEIKKAFDARIDALASKEFETLSNSEMAWLKGVAVSSIMAMKKKGYNNNQIMTTHQREAQTQEQKASKLISALSDEQLLALGLARV